MERSAFGENGDDQALPGYVNPADQRVAPRHTLLIRAAKLIVNSAEYVCVLRDASETGISLRLFHEVPTSGQMVLELQNQDRHEVELVWRDGERMGLRFREPVDIHRLIEMPAPFDRRPIRVRTDFSASIAFGDDATPCTVRDLSQHGAKVICTRHFAIDQRVRLIASAMPTVQAKVRWRRNDQLGLSFENTFQLGELALIIASAHQGSMAAARAREVRAG